MSELDKLRWRCRRGTLELDLMLTRYLDNRYQEACREEQQTFLDLLALEDNELQGYLLGEQFADETNLSEIIMIIRQLPASTETIGTV